MLTTTGFFALASITACVMLSLAVARSDKLEVSTYEIENQVVSYTYDTNVCSYEQQSTMLPPGDRQIVGGGISWRITQNLQLDVTYALVIMDAKSMHMSDALGRNYRMECRHGLSHAGGCTLTYRF